MARKSDFIKAASTYQAPMLITTAIFAGVIGTYVSIKALAASSPEVKHRVGRSAVKVTTDSSKPSAMFGESIGLTAHVPATCGNGTVSFYDGAAVDSNLLGSAPVKSGKAALATASLSPGRHQIRSSFRGSSTCQPALSLPIAEEIVKPTGVTKATATILASSRTNVAAKTPVNLIANVTGDCGPTGNINFYDGAINPSTLLGTAPYRDGRAVLRLTMNPGPHKVVAAYDGDTSCDKSVSSAITQMVAQ